MKEYSKPSMKVIVLSSNPLMLDVSGGGKEDNGFGKMPGMRMDSPFLPTGSLFGNPFDNGLFGEGE